MLQNFFGTMIGQWRDLGRNLPAKFLIVGSVMYLAGCFQGFQVKGDSEEVGTRTTTAVVQSIFLVIILDAVFAIFFSSIGWR